MKLAWKFLFQFCISLSLIQAQQVKPATCITPNNDVGVCVDVAQCSIFMDVIRNKKQESYDFVRASQCESQEKTQHPTVCCGMYDSYVNQQTTPRTTPNRLVIPATGLFPKTCGQALTSGERIFGGNEAQLGQFPWMARLRHLRSSDGLFSYGCAGFLISEKFVLTAAHCILSQFLAPLGPIYQIQLGEHNTETDPDCGEEPRICADPPQYLRNAEPIVHPDYSNDNNYHNDIAVIPLIEPAKLTKYVQPICLTNTSSNHNYFWLSGWGKTENASHSTVKLNVLVPTADWNQCYDLYKARKVTLLRTQICAGGVPGKDACTGDSGGPLMTVRNNNWYAEGIVSLGKGCGERGWPGIYTHIPNYMSWIELVMIKYFEEQEEIQEENVPVLVQHTETRYIWNR